MAKPDYTIETGAGAKALLWFQRFVWLGIAPNIVLTLTAMFCTQWVIDQVDHPLGAEHRGEREDDVGGDAEPDEALKPQQRFRTRSRLYRVVGFGHTRLLRTSAGRR